MGLLPDVFLELRPCDWHAMKRGFLRREEKQWEHTRLIVAALTGEKPEKIIKLSSDRPRQVQRTTEADKQRILDKYRHRLNPST
jgi:hypothetical protein